VPRTPGPGILMLDDFNRADQRILQGIMQLLQFNGMFSWSLPDDWMIVCTANPEGGDYNVTPLDDAMITRLVHVAMVFDVRDWAGWALKDGLDSRVLSWVLAYPKIVTGGRDTPRSIAQFADFTAAIPNLTSDEGIDLVQTFGEGTLSEAALASFIGFITTELQYIPSGRDLLNAKTPEILTEMMEKAAIGPDGEEHLDRLYILLIRLIGEITAENYKQGANDARNAAATIMHPLMPRDMSFMAFKWIASYKTPIANAIADDPNVAMMILDSM